MRERHEKERKGHEIEKARLHNACEHLVVEYWPDPSGNNDSHEECLVCGHQAVRIRRKEPT